MIKPLKTLSKIPSITLNWFLYSSIHPRRIGQKGEYTTESVIQIGWADRNLGLGFLFVNLFADTPQTISLEVDPSQYNLKNNQYNAKIKMSDKETNLGTFKKKKQLEITLPPRKVVLLEIKKSS